MYKFRMALIFCILFGGSLPEATQGQNIESKIKAAGLEMMKAFTQKDFRTFLKFMHPKLIEMAGGEDSLLQKMDSANKIATQFGAEVKRITIGNPYKVIQYKRQLQATLPQTTEIKFLSGTIILETTLIAISSDRGRHWYFIDTNIYHADQLKNKLPDLSPDLVIPPQKKPEIRADEE